jgi:hypothetical protein
MKLPIEKSEQSQHMRTSKTGKVYWETRTNRTDKKGSTI